MPGILDLFIPRERRFFDLLEELSGKTLTGTNLFLKFVNNYSKQSAKERQATIGQLKDVEHKCDEVTHHIAVELNKTFLTPIDREDIHRLSTLVDDIMDIIYNIGHKLVLYDIKKIPKYLPELAQAAARSAEEVDFLISTLGDTKKVGTHIDRIHQLEQEGDSLRNEAFAYLFNDSLSAVDIIKFKDLYERLEGVCDKAEDIADVVEGITIKYA